ncbi:MAG: MBL fold metallo-hydrolase [Chthoniobacterales bacterium]
MLLRQIFDPYLAQYAYLIGCQRSGEALIIDPERDIDRYKLLAAENGLKITAVAETHIHADFVSGGQEFAKDPEVHLYLSAEGGPDWTYKWPGARPHTHLLHHGDHFFVGNIRVEAIHTPGHTPEHLSYLITDIGGGADEPVALATGDFVFVGDVGRPDLLESAAGQKGVMEPSARQLQHSLHERLQALTDYLQILPAHGAGSACGKSLGAIPTSTLGYERRFNAPLKLALKDRETFVKQILAGQPEPPLYFATMKRVNRDGIAVTGGVPSPPHMSAEQLRNNLDNLSLCILDTRESRENFDAAHLPRALYAPLHTPFFSTSAGSFLSENDKLLLVLENSEDLDSAVRQLYRIGFDHIAGWLTLDEAKAENLPLVSIPRVDFSQFDPVRAISEGYLIDVRTSAEYEQGHIDGALSFPYTRIKEHIAKLPTDRPLFIHCGSGKRAALAASFLRAQKFDATHIDGTCSECERIALDAGIMH